MKCPTCNTELKMSERSGIEIDYCPQCRGVWLDRGEMDKIIERSGSESMSQQKRDDNEGERHSGNENYFEKENYYNKNENHDDKHYEHRKRKSFLGDLFDF